MIADFSRTLALLRQEKGLSQRKAAKELGISQALLSHYEKGIREPGLVFVVRACDFYNVSADFLLGRTPSRDGTTILGVESLYDVTGERDNVLQGSVMAVLAKKLAVNSAGILFDLLGRLGSKKAIKAASNVMSSTVYMLYRRLHHSSRTENEAAFAVPFDLVAGGLPRADIILNEVDYAEALLSEQKSGTFPPLSHEELSAAYPGAYQSLMQMIHVCEGRLNGELSGRREASR